ncbi:TonB-dependent receptor [Sphingomonas oryzagri]
MRKSATASILFVLLSSTSAYAQETAAPANDQTAPPATPGPAPAASDDKGIGDIVVTAQRFSQSVQKSALTIQVVDSKQLDRTGVTAVADLSKLSTGVDIAIGGSSAQIYIRGVGDRSFNPLANPGVAFNVDGVYVGRPDGLGGNFYDINRVEILKGPQGTLYGRNANGGSINVITNEPKLGELGGDFSVEVGNYSLIHATGAINIPVGDTAALRAAYNVVNRDGYLSDGSGDDVQKSARLRFKWEPSSDVTLLLNGDYSHLSGNPSGYVYLPGRPGSDPWEGTADPRSIAYRNSMPPLGPLLDPSVPKTFQDTTLWNISAQLDWKLPFATLTILPAYRNADIYTASYPGFLYQQPNKVEQKSLEVRLGNTSPALTWVVGGYAFRETGEGSIRVIQSSIVQDSQFNYVPKTTSLAGFGQATLKLFEGFRLIAGGRYTYEHRELDGVYLDMRPVPFGPGPGTVLERFPGTKNFDGVTYKAGFEYDIAPANMVYFTSSSGFKAGGLNETVAPANIYQPEKLQSLEFGSRNRFFDNRLQINFGLYRWKYKGLQDQRVTFDPLGLINLIFFNVGDATIKGATADIVVKPTRADTLSASVEYADSHYDRFQVSLPTPVFFPGSIGCPTTVVGSNTVANCAGLQVARVPKWNGTVNYNHIITLADTSTIDVGGSMKFASSRWLATDFIPAERAPAYAVFDANLTYTTADKRISVTGFVRNIGNKAYSTGGIEQPFIPGLFAASISPPRTYGLRASFKFGN